MEKQMKRKAIYVGLFGFLGLGLLVGFIIFAGRYAAVLGGAYRIRVQYSFLDNLRLGARVRVSAGPEVGQVERIDLDGEKIIVTLQIRREFRINRGARFNIYTTGMVGQRYVNISGYTPYTTDFLTNNELVVGVTPMGFSRVLEVAGMGLQSMISGDNIEVIHRVRDTFENTAELVEGLNMLVKENSADIRSSVANLSKVMRFSEDMMKSINTTVLNLEVASAQLNRRIEAIDQRQLEATMRDIQTTTEELRKFSQELNRLTHDRDGVISLLRSKETKTSLDNTIKNLEAFSEKISADPRRLFFR